MTAPLNVVRNNNNMESSASKSVEPVKNNQAQSEQTKNSQVQASQTSSDTEVKKEKAV